MTIEEQWRALATELGFEFKEGIRGFLESPILRRILSEKSSAEGTEMPTAMLENPMVMSLLAKVFPGHITGIYRSFEFHLYSRGSSKSTSDSEPRSTNVILLFSKNLDIGLVIEPKGQDFFSKFVDKFFRGGAIDTGDSEFYKRVKIQARNEAQALASTGRIEMQRAWIALSSGLWEPRVTDESVSAKMWGKQIVDAQAAKDVMERMADLAKTLI